MAQREDTAEMAAGSPGRGATLRGPQPVPEEGCP